MSDEQSYRPIRYVGGLLYLLSLLKASQEFHDILPSGRIPLFAHYANSLKEKADAQKG